MLVRDDKAQCSCSGSDEPHLMASSSSPSGREWMGWGGEFCTGGPGGCIDHKIMILVSKGSSTIVKTGVSPGKNAQLVLSF